jgi:hypothetical protein
MFPATRRYRRLMASTAMPSATTQCQAPLLAVRGSSRGTAGPPPVAGRYGFEATAINPGTGVPASLRVDAESIECVVRPAALIAERTWAAA